MAKTAYQLLEFADFAERHLGVEVGVLLPELLVELASEINRADKWNDRQLLR